MLDRGNSEKTLNFEYKRNAEKIMNIKHNKFSGIFTSQPEVAKIVEEKISQLGIDDLGSIYLNFFFEVRFLLHENTHFYSKVSGN